MHYVANKFDYFPAFISTYARARFTFTCRFFLHCIPTHYKLTIVQSIYTYMNIVLHQCDCNGKMRQSFSKHSTVEWKRWLEHIEHQTTKLETCSIRNMSKSTDEKILLLAVRFTSCNRIRALPSRLHCMCNVKRIQTHSKIIIPFRHSPMRKRVELCMNEHRTYTRYQQQQKKATENAFLIN